MDEFNLIPTNSLINASFDALKMDADDDTFTDVLSATAMNMDESYFVKSIGFLNQLNESYTDSKIKLYRCIAESNDSAILLESFSDYYVQMEAIVDKFLRFLDNQINSFNQITTAYMDEAAIIKEHKKALTEEIKNYSDDNTEGFNYTIREDIPDLSLVDNFNASLFDNLFHSGVNDLSVDSVKETISAMQLEQDVRNFRARILGMDGELSDNEFVNQLRLVFRDNVSGAIELDIDEKSIKTIAEQWFSKYGFKSQLTEQYKKIEKSYQGLMKKVSTICKNNNGLTVSAFTNLMPGDIGVKKIEGKDINNNGMMMSADMMLQIDIYTKAKLDQLQKYTDVTCMVMGAKMDAMKDKIRQDRGILLKAIEVLDHPDDYYDARESKGKANRNATMASVEAPSEDEESAVEEGAIKDFVGRIKKKIEAGKAKRAKAKAERERLRKENEARFIYIADVKELNIDNIPNLVKPLTNYLNKEMKKTYPDLKTLSDSDMKQMYDGIYYFNDYKSVVVVESGYPDKYWNSEDSQKEWDDFCDWIEDITAQCNKVPEISKIGKVYYNCIDDLFCIYIEIKNSLLKKPGKEDSDND